MSPATFLGLTLCLSSGVACSPADRSPAAASVWQPAPLGTAARLEAIDFPDSNNGWVVGGSHLVAGGLLGRSADGGISWQWLSGILPGSATQSLHAVHATDAQRAFAVGGNGLILRTLDGGAHWHTVHADAHQRPFTSLGFVDADFGWASGRGRLLVSRDAGDSWTAVGSDDEDSRYSEWGAHVQFVDHLTAWSAGPHGAVHVTRDGGRNWEEVWLPIAAAPSRPSFRALHFVDPQHGWIVGEEGTLFRTADGGASWVQQDTGQPDTRTRPRLEVIRRQHGIDTLDAGDVHPGLVLTAVRFIDTRRGWLTGVYPGSTRSVIIATSDGGDTWTLEASVEGEALSALEAHANARVWAVGARSQPGEQLIQLRIPR